MRKSEFMHQAMVMRSGTVMRDRIPLETAAPRMLTELEAFADVVAQKYPFDPEPGQQVVGGLDVPMPNPATPQFVMVQPEAAAAVSTPQAPVVAAPPTPAVAPTTKSPEPDGEWKPPPPPVQGVAGGAPQAAPAPRAAQGPARPPKAIQNMPQSMLAGAIAKGTECTICKVPLTADHVCKPRPLQPGEDRVPIPES
jgi:hypothetical protein